MEVFHPDDPRADPGSREAGDTGDPGPSPWPPGCDLFEPRPADAAELSARCSEGRFVSDAWVDALLPEPLQHASTLHFTPAGIALRGARLLAEHGARRVLDVGAGVGKFCALAPLAAEVELVGVEHRAPLVEAGTRLIRALGSHRRARMSCGDALAADWGAFDALYFYNPFAEADHPPGSWIDQSQPFDGTHSWRCTRAALEKLDALAAGTLVLTYHGLGAPLGSGWEYLASERHRTGALELLRKL